MNLSENTINKLLLRANINANIGAVKLCSNGHNNRLYHIETTAGDFVVKQYFRHKSDERDRLKAEYDFLSYTSDVAPQATPRALVFNSLDGLALYEFIIGDEFEAGKIGLPEIDLAINFLTQLNQSSTLIKTHLSFASEACFSIDEHLSSVDKRICKLLQLSIKGEIDKEAIDFFHSLNETWKKVSKGIVSQSSEAYLDRAVLLTPQQRCISPSDFGFHNALRKKNGDICFIDFEYAGWDDPAKMINDFFLQPTVPVPMKFYDHFIDKVMGLFDEQEMLLKRTKCLFSAYQIKWCCIVLNVFIPVHCARRQFSDPSFDENKLKREQLNMAKDILHTIETTSYGLY